MNYKKLIKGFLGKSAAWLAILSIVLPMNILAATVTFAAGQTDSPTVTDPSAPVTVSVDHYTIIGSVHDHSSTLVTLYIDVNNDGLLDSGDSLVTSENFGSSNDVSYKFDNVILNPGANHFLVTALKHNDDTVSDPTVVPTITYQADTTAPVVTVDTLTTTNTTPTLTGTIDDPTADISITVNSHTYSATNNGTTWSADVTNALSVGTYNVLASATDPANNVGTDTTTNELTIQALPDTTPPTDPTANPVAGTYNSTQSVTLSSSDDSGFYTIYYTTNGDTPTNSSLEEYSGTITVSADETIKAIAYDTAGNHSDVSTFSYIIDTSLPDNTAPNQPILVSPENNAIINGTSVTQSWTDTSSDVDHYIYESYNDASATSLRWHEEFSNDSKTATNVPESTYWWRVKAVDAAGNESDWSELRKITIDNTAPVVSITSPSNNDLLSGTVTISGTVIDNNPDHYYLVVKDSSNHVVAGPGVKYLANVADYNWDTTLVSDGTYTIDLEARDAAGNKDSNSIATIQVVVDNTAPVVTINNYTGTDTTPTLTGTIDDPTADISVTVNGHTYPATKNGTTWSADVTNALSVGTYNVLASATDPANNVGTDTTTNELTIQTPGNPDTNTNPPTNSNNPDNNPIITTTSTTPTTTTTGTTPTTTTTFNPLAFNTNTGNTNNPNTTTDNTTTPTDNSGQVQGATNDKKNNDNNGNVKGASTSKNFFNSLWNALGWWWLLVLLLIGWLLWFLLAWKRRKREEDNIR